MATLPSRIRTLRRNLLSLALLAVLSRRCSVQSFHFSAHRLETRSVSNKLISSKCGRSDMMMLHSKSPLVTEEPVKAQEKRLEKSPTEQSPSSTADLDSSLEESSASSNFLGLSDEALGLLVLGTVPVVWGSYVPVVRALYEIDPPIPGFVFSTAYFAVASASAFTLLNIRERNGDSTLTEASAGTEKSLSPFLAGAELGLYLFLGNSLQVIGLKTVPSDRAGFLVQLTTIIVPLLQATLSGGLQSVSSRTWTACVIALLGITVMGYDGNGALSVGSLELPSLTSGDALILGAAVVYSLHVVRLGRWANETAPLRLVAYKATTELILGILTMYALVSVASGANGVDATGLMAFFQESGNEIVTFFDRLTERISAGTLPAASVQKAVAATLWTGLVSTAYTTYAQSFGQRRVKPADANLVYSLQPIFTAAFAYILSGETMGQYGILGGGLIGTAVYLAASQSFVVERSDREER